MISSQPAVVTRRPGPAGHDRRVLIATAGVVVYRRRYRGLRLFNLASLAQKSPRRACSSLVGQIRRCACGVLPHPAGPPPAGMP
jgi:hypothetical protein